MSRFSFGCLRLAALLAAAAMVTTAWAGPPKKEAAAEAKSAAAKAGDEEEKLEPYQCGKVQRLHTLGGVFLASQPAKEDFTHAKEGGIKTVLNLREKDEMDWDEGELVKSLGMEYVNVPFKSPSTLTDEVFDKTRKLFGDKEKRPLLVHCASANRVGAVWLAHRVLDGGKTYDEALKEAKTVGLKLPAYEEKAKDYIARMQKKGAAKKE
ncbi:MAG: protein tyrosine phosphatase family protein [Pirellulales bacterium]